MTRAERETVIRWDSESNVATVYTCHTRIKTLIEKRGVCAQKIDKNGGREVSWWYEIPASWVRIYPKRKTTHLQGFVSRVAVK